MNIRQIPESDLIKLYGKLTQRKNKLWTILYDRYSTVVIESPSEHKLIKLEYMLCDEIISKSIIIIRMADHTEQKYRNKTSMGKMVTCMILKKKECIKKLEMSEFTPDEKHELKACITILNKYLKVIQLEKLPL